MKLRSLLTFTLTLTLGLCAVSAQEQVALQLDLPKPLFVGTPRPIKMANLEVFSHKRPDFMVPAGTVLLSAGKEVTSSDEFPVIGELGFVTDGDKTGMDGSFLEIGPGTQWVQIDLGASSPLAAIVVWHFHSQARVYHDFIVQVSDDKTFKTGVTTLYNTDDDNSSALGAGKDVNYIESNMGRIVDAKGTKARYVRLYSNGNTSNELNHYCEVEVFGTPAK
ncbi:discoidin domain-containing protein [Oleiharenicola lentus]|jgi:hypothetical protein|uniref:Discoidin domain-containing protein n=1 Tax=Oleiharenicola lentus TaxID=2508720 RepID=A0A4Q1CAR9_9BACT|nr:discoidin domain-containing protein [Oleiharenicola lentus]RXK56020.1 discoidin domain-containing protein [Oleiharenicola lentus]